jgi:L-glyceraldehyde 3-phosphate reductase
MNSLPTETRYEACGQTLAQMAITWVLQHEAMTSALIRANKVSQIEEIVGVLDSLTFTEVELQATEAVLNEF